jgi:hypothetical protein
MQASTTSSTNNLMRIATEILRITSTPEHMVDKNELVLILREFFMQYRHDLTLEDYTTLHPQAFSLYLYCYAKYSGIAGFFNDQTTFLDIKEFVNIDRAHKIREKMINAGMRVQCLCGEGGYHTAPIDDVYVYCEAGTYVKVVYSESINNFQFVFQNAPFLMGQCYARRIILEYNDGWYHFAEDDSLDNWKDIRLQPTLPYDPNDAEMDEFNEFRVAGPSHEELLKLQQQRIRGEMVPTECRRNEDPAIGIETNNDQADDFHDDPFFR